MRIELVGGMGIGKTTLCNVLSDIGYHCILEDLGENPFLAKMYKDEEGFRFPSQMWFILSKYAELQAELRSGEINVIDQAVLNIRAYTNMLFKENRCDKEWGLIEGLFDYIEGKFGKPDLLIYLKASPDIQMKRIHARNRDYELDVNIAYLENLKQEIELLLNHEKAQGQAVVEVDTDDIFLADHRVFATQLADDIAKRLKFCINPKQGNIGIAKTQSRKAV
jgi:deoxyadenosine/deoxycytidine kinase